MNRSELFARYWLYGWDMEPIDEHEYLKAMHTYENLNVTKTDGYVHISKVSSDGCDYYMFTCVWPVGWEGDHEHDGFYCKVKTMTESEMRNLINSCDFLT